MVGIMVCASTGLMRLKIFVPAVSACLNACAVQPGMQQDTLSFMAIIVLIMEVVGMQCSRFFLRSCAASAMAIPPLQLLPAETDCMLGWGSATRSQERCAVVLLLCATPNMGVVWVFV